MASTLKYLRVLGIILLIVLASVGIGITGAAPILPKNKGILDRLTHIEQVENQQEDLAPLEEEARS